MEPLCVVGVRLLARTAGLAHRNRLLGSLTSTSAAADPQPARRVSHRELQQRADQLLSAAIAAERAPTAADWERVTTEYRRHVPAANSATIDHKVLGACRAAGSPALAAARSLLRHRWTQGAVPPANLALFLELLASCDAAARHAADADALAAHAALSSAPLDRLSAGRAVVGLCSTRHWRLALPLMPVARRGGAPPRAALSALAAAALRAGDDAVGWEALEELSAARLRPVDDALDAWLERCEARGHAESRAALRGERADERAADVAQETEPAEEMVRRLLRYLASSGAMLSEQQAMRLRDLCTQRLVRPWTGQATQVSNRGRCEHCGLQLPPARLSDDDFGEVREALEQRVLIGEDVFQSSTPQEVARFKELVRRTAPYDVVVDGLNVSLATAPTKGAPLTRALVQVVDHFAVREGKKVLVIGRYHMHGWKKKDMGFVKRHALLFTADNMSADDAFLLYAVLHSHPATQFVTRDFFRDHAARLPAETRSKFNRLVRSNRLAVEGITPNGNLNIKMPIAHSVEAQCDPAGGWHVPFCEAAQLSVSTTTPSPTQPVTDRWLCLRPPPPHR